MKIFCKFPTVNIVSGFLKVIFSMFRFVCTLRLHIFKQLYIGQILRVYNLCQIELKLHFHSLPLGFRSGFMGDVSIINQQWN